MKRKCSMCGECKEESTNFRFLNKQSRYYCYCNDCNKFYNKNYVRKTKAKGGI